MIRNIWILLVCAPLFAQTQSSLTVVSAADYEPQTPIGLEQWYCCVAVGSIVSMFATNISAGNFFASSLPLPTNLGGISATVTDQTGNTQPIQLLAVTPQQVNAVIPAAFSMALGLECSPCMPVTVNLTASDGHVISGQTVLSTAAPSLFTADESGDWLPAAQVLTVHADGSRTFMSSVAQYSETLVWNGLKWSHYIPIPIDVGTGTDQVILELFGTGIRGWNTYPKWVLDQYMSVSWCTACGDIGGEDDGELPMLYAGPQGTFAGLDQVNVLLPYSLAGRGLLTVTLNDGYDLSGGSNKVQILIQ